jgi:hypothetical protein
VKQLKTVSVLKIENPPKHLAQITQSFFVQATLLIIFTLQSQLKTHLDEHVLETGDGRADCVGESEHRDEIVAGEGVQ